LTGLDPRLHAFRPDLADESLRGRVEAARYVAGMSRRVTAPFAPLKRAPDEAAGLDTEILYGEIFHVFEDREDGWSWGQLETDSYVGYVPSAALGALGAEPTHRVIALRTFLYPDADLKHPALAVLPLGGRLALAGESETRGTLYRHVEGGGAVVACHVAPLDAPPAPDFVAVAGRFLGTPYLWGGRTSIGLDCSALVQLSLREAGMATPRDTDMQERALGEPVSLSNDRRRGDLVFWKGHVGILESPDRLLHASGHHMEVVSEPLEDALARIARSAGPPTSVRRLPGLDNIRAR